MSARMEYDLEYIRSVALHRGGEPPHVIPPAIGFVVKADKVLHRPSLIIWDPVQQFPHLKIICPFHEEELVTTERWRDCKNRMPRKMYGLSGPVFLVARNYRCPASHEIISTDYGIIQSLTSRGTHVPFMVTHKVGMMEDVMLYINNRVQAGHKFSELEGFLTENNRWQFESWRKASYKGHQDISLVTFEAYKALWSNLCPSDTMMHNIFLQTFHKEEHLYDRAFDLVTGSTIIIDQTFALPALIGYAREDKTWETLYQGLLIATSTSGQVMAFQLVKSRDVHEGTLLLQDLQARCQGGNGLQVMVHDCCMWRDFLQGMTGTSSSTVWLNLDHAIHTIMETIPEDNPMRKRFVKKFRLVFRSESDYGSERTLPTPGAAKMLDNFNTFLRSWRSSEHLEGQVISDDTLNSLETLRIHITKGCLSGIPSNVSGARNEKLHNLLKNSALVGIRFGIEMANALLNTIFYRWNTQKVLSEGLPLPPVWSTEPVIDPTSAETSETTSAVSETDSEPETTSAGPPRPRHPLSPREAHAWSHALADVYRHVHDNHRTVDLQIHWFAECSVNCEDVWEFLFNTEASMEDNIKAFDLSPIEVQGSSPPSVWDAILAPIAQQADTANLEIPLILRKNPLVTEAGSKSSMTLDQIHEVLVLASMLLSTVIIAVVPAKICPFVPFVTVSEGDKSYIYVTIVSDKDDLFSVKPMKFNNSKKRNAAGLEDDGETIPAKVKVVEGCRCGESSKGLKSACTNAPEKDSPKRGYKSRCSCLKDEKGCMVTCRCVNCANPHGKRVFAPPAVHVPVKRSKRQETKRPCLRPLKGIDFLEASDDFVPTGIWSTVETLCLYICAGTLDSAGDGEDIAGVYIRKLRDMYMSVQRHCIYRECKWIPLGPKSLARVRCKYWNIISRRTARRVMSWCNANATDSPDHLRNTEEDSHPRSNTDNHPVDSPGRQHPEPPQGSAINPAASVYHGTPLGHPVQDMCLPTYHGVVPPACMRKADDPGLHPGVPEQPYKGLGSAVYHSEGSTGSRPEVAPQNSAESAQVMVRHHGMPQNSAWDSRPDTSSAARVPFHAAPPVNSIRSLDPRDYTTSAMCPPLGSMMHHKAAAYNSPQYLAVDKARDSGPMNYRGGLPPPSVEDSRPINFCGPLPPVSTEDSGPINYSDPVSAVSTKGSGSVPYQGGIRSDSSRESQPVFYQGGACK